MSKKFGFTLAEVLITLGIIGVVASMTIPTIINQTSGAEYKTGLKKMVSALNQAITMNVALEGTDFSTLTSGVADGSIYNMFAERMSTSKMTTATVSTMGTPFSAAGQYTVFFNDGMAVVFPTGAANCTRGTTSTTCNIIIDVNGGKGPNKMSTATSGTVGIFDQYVFRMGGQEVVPVDDSARFALYN